MTVDGSAPCEENEPLPVSNHLNATVERELEFYEHGNSVRGVAAVMRKLIHRSIGEYSSFPEFFKLFDARDRVALDYGCGRGYIAVRLAKAGASSVTGIDLSNAEVEHAQRRAADSGLGDRISFVVGDAHHTPFGDESFDLIVGAAILHHLDLRSSLLEVRRLLRPGGVAVFVEPLWHNPILRLGRLLSPGTRTADEHPLRAADWELCSSMFESFTHTERELLSIPLMPFNLVVSRRGQAKLARSVARADNRLLARFPGLSKYARVTFLHFASDDASHTPPHPQGVERPRE